MSSGSLCREFFHNSHVKILPRDAGKQLTNRERLENAQLQNQTGNEGEFCG